MDADSGVTSDGVEAGGRSGQPAIQVLADDVVDQIAAGEVVERPASVVKELVENALDAGATHIAVEVVGGGKELIRVLDNGCGMKPAEVRLALQRHATSKIRAVADLFSLQTMGFRGEALPSIAAVSKLTIVTRTRDDVAALRLEIEAGNVVKSSEVGAPVGTQVEVRELLYNVPARLKFLKGQATESSHVTEAVSRLAMAHPHVHFRLRHGSRTAIDAPPQVDAETGGFERARALLGSRLGKRLHRVTGEENGIAVVAYLAAPELAQSTSRGVQMFVGRRPVRDRSLLHAVVMGYGELVRRGRYPVVVLFVDVPNEAVDVNVHPQKLEVRFSDLQAVCAAVRHTVSRGVAQAPWLCDAPAEDPSAIRMRAFASAAPPPRRARASDVAADYAEKRSRMLLPWKEVKRGGRAQVANLPLAPSVDAPERLQGDSASARSPEYAPTPVAEAADPEPGAGTFFSELRYLGQLDRTYLLCEGHGELVLIDQHAAHERVEFQRLRRSYQEHSIAVQTLLFPQTLELTPQQRATAADAIDELRAVGFEVEPFGGETFALKAVPAGLRGGEGAGVLRDLLDELESHGGSRAVEDRLDAVLSTVACHSVVRAGDVLSPREAEALLVALDDVDFRAHCPHGRPCLLRISVGELARRFGR